MTLTIYTSQDTKFNPDFRYHDTYLHGQLEKDMGYDIFSFNEKTNFCPGIHHIIINSRQCIFILWEADKKYKGYLIYKNDEEMGYCIDKYLRKVTLI